MGNEVGDEEVKFGSADHQSSVATRRYNALVPPNSTETEGDLGGAWSCSEFLAIVAK